MKGMGGGAAARAAGMAAGARGAAAQDRPSKLDWRLMARIYHYTHPHARKRNWVFALTALRSAQRPAMGFLLGWVVNHAIAPGDLARTLWGAAAFTVLAIVTEWTFYIRQRSALELGESVVHDLRADFVSHLQDMTLSYFHRTRLGSVLSRMISDMESVRRGVQHVFFFTPMLFGMMLISSLLMLWQNATLFMVLAAVAPVIALVNHLFRERMTRASRAVQASQSRVTGKVAESVNGMRVIQSYVQEENNLAQYGTLVNTHAANNVRMGRNQALYQSLIELNSQAFLALLLAVGGYAALNGWSSIQAADVISFLFLSNHFFHPLQQIGRVYTDSVVAMAGAERIFSVLDEAPEWRDPTAAPVLRVSEGHIELRQVSFSYGSGKRALENIDLDLAPGSMLALVGATGSGKSTLASLIGKLYLPQSGRILVDGQDLALHDTASWRRQISVVPQRNVLFTGSVLDNIRLGKLDASEDEVRAAAAALDCLGLIDHLPQGLHTQVGEYGHALSLGTRQLICFVRAWLADPRLLILDEATSAIDTLTEARLQRALNRLLVGRSSIVIAHRLSTVRRADQICVLDHGHIIEQGRHAELIAHGGVYAQLYAQFISSSIASSGTASSAVSGAASSVA